MWIHRNGRNNSLAVLIHGVCGHPLSTWAGLLEILQGETRVHPGIRSWDIYAFGYPTGWLSQPPVDEIAVEGLRVFLDRHRDRYDTVALVAHSQGGIVAKLYVIQELLASRGLDLRVDLIVTLGTPHRGYLGLLPVWVLSQALGGMPVLGPRHIFRQFGDLSSWGRTFKALREGWNETLISRVPIDPEPNRRYIRSIAISGGSDMIVNRVRSSGFGIDIKRNVWADHGGMPKPGSRRDEQARILAEELGHHLAPTDVLEQINAIWEGGQETVREFLKRLGRKVAPLIRRNRGLIGKEGLTAKTSSLLMDFLYDFQYRPLRNLQFDEAVVEFANRCLTVGR